MATETNPAPIKNDWKKATDKIAALKEHLKSLEGKVNTNPFLWMIKNNFAVLEEACKDTSKQTQASYEAIMKLEDKPSCNVEGVIFAG